MKLGCNTVIFSQLSLDCCFAAHRLGWFCREPSFVSSGRLGHAHRIGYLAVDIDHVGIRRKNITWSCLPFKSVWDRCVMKTIFNYW